MLNVIAVESQLVRLQQKCEKWGKKSTIQKEIYCGHKAFLLHELDRCRHLVPSLFITRHEKAIMSFHKEPLYT